MRRTIKGAAALAAISAAAMAVAPMASADRFVEGAGVPGAVSGVNGGNVYGSDRIGTSLQALTAFDPDLSATSYKSNVEAAVGPVSSNGYYVGVKGDYAAVDNTKTPANLYGAYVAKNSDLDNLTSPQFVGITMAVRVGDQTKNVPGIKTDLYIVSTTSIVDALSLAPISKGNGVGGYVVYANKAGLDERGAEALKDLVAAQRLNRVFIVGGDAVLASSVEQQIYSLEQQVAKDWTAQAMDDWNKDSAVHALAKYSTDASTYGWATDGQAKKGAAELYTKLSKAAYAQFMSVARANYDIEFVRLSGADRYQTSYLAGAWAADYDKMVTGYNELWMIEEAGLRAWFANAEVQRTFADLQKAQGHVDTARADLIAKEGQLAAAYTALTPLPVEYASARSQLNAYSAENSQALAAKKEIKTFRDNITDMIANVQAAGYTIKGDSNLTQLLGDLTANSVGDTALTAPEDGTVKDQKKLDDAKTEAKDVKKFLDGMAALPEGYVKTGVEAFVKAKNFKTPNNDALSSMALKYFMLDHKKNVGNPNLGYTAQDAFYNDAVEAIKTKLGPAPDSTSLLPEGVDMVEAATLYDVINYARKHNDGVLGAAQDLQKSQDAYQSALMDQATAEAAYADAQHEAIAAGEAKIAIDAKYLPTAANKYAKAQVNAYQHAVKGVYFSTGENFADALTAGPVAGKDAGNIVLLTPGKTFGTWDKAAALYVGQNGGSFYAVGGPAAEAAKAAKVELAGTYAGKDRFETSVILNNAAFGANKAMYIVASGETGADAVVAGAYQVSNSHNGFVGGIILTKKSELPASADTFFKSLRWGSQVVAFFGGNQVITNDVRAQVLNDMGASKNVLANYIGDNTFAYGN